MTKFYSKAVKMAKEIKSQNSLSVIIGGTHISATPSSLSPYFDFGIIGEGEKTLVDLCIILYSKGKFDSCKLNDIHGLVYWDNNTQNKTLPQKMIENLDDLPMPDFTLLDDRYFKKSG